MGNYDQYRKPDGMGLNAIISELQAFFWFDLERKVIGQNGGHVLVV